MLPSLKTQINLKAVIRLIINSWTNSSSYNFNVFTQIFPTAAATVLGWRHIFEILDPHSRLWLRMRAGIARLLEIQAKKNFWNFTTYFSKKW